MQQKTNSEQEEQSNGQSSTEEATKETYLNETIQGGPLRIVGSTTQGFCITFGKYRISQMRKTEDEAKGDLIYNYWEIIVNLIAVIQGMTQELKDQMK